MMPYAVVQQRGETIVRIAHIDRYPLYGRVFGMLWRFDGYRITLVHLKQRACA